MAIISVGDPNDIKRLHFVGRFDQQRFPTQASQERAVWSVIHAVETIHGTIFEGKAELKLVKNGNSYTLSLTLKDDKVALARQIGLAIHLRLKDVWPPGTKP